MSQDSSLPGLTGRTIVCVGFNDWDNEVWTNQHHLMYRLAACGVEVLFVESLGLRRPALSSGRDLRRIARRLKRGFAGPRQKDGVHVLSPLVLPLHSRQWARALNARALVFQVKRSLSRLGLRAPSTLWAYVPHAESLLDALAPETVIYHCVDDIAAQRGIDESSFRRAEERFARRADLVIASSPALARRMHSLSDNVLYAPNVADTKLFSSALHPGPLDSQIAALPEPRIVFVGAIAANKLDLPLLAALASERPDWSFILVGPVGLGDPGTDVSQLTSLPNVHLLGARPQSQLPSILRGAAVGLIPYRKTLLTESIFPMKVYEYLAAGLPVIASGLPSLAEVEGVTVVSDPPEALNAIESALASNSESQRRDRSASVREHSWESRLREISAALV